jgi:ligand-binding sensor domain-containing protein
LVELIEYQYQKNSTKWFGTEVGAARHSGNITLDNQTVYTTEDGLADNYVQSICGDKEGNIWIGTHGGISVFNVATWISYTMNDGLVSNHILSIAIDLEDVVWIGTGDGISCYKDRSFIKY